MADGAPARATRRKAQRSAKKSATRAKRELYFVNGAKDLGRAIDPDEE